MSVISSTKNWLSERVNSFLREMVPDNPITRRQFIELMEDEFGNDWQDRLNVINTDLTPDKLKKILKQASPRSSGQLGALYELMYKVRKDARVGGMIDKRAEAVTRSIVDFHSGNPDNPEANEAAEELERWYESIKMKSLFQLQMDGKFYGVTAFQNVIYQDPTGFYYIEDPTKHQISQSRWGMGIGNDRDGTNRWGKLYLRRGGNDTFTDRSGRLYIDDERDIDPYKLSTLIYQDKVGYYDTTGILYPITNLYLIKVYAATFWMRFAERHGKPFVYANLSKPNFKDDEFKSTIRLLLQNLGSQRWGIFPEGMTVDHLDTNSAASSDLYNKLIDFANVEMAIGILGQNLSTEVQGGSFAAATSHASVEEKKTEGDVEWLEEANNDTYSFLLTKLNHPDLPIEDYPYTSMTPKKNVNLTELGRGYREITRLIDVPAEEIYKEAQIRMPRENPDYDAQDNPNVPRYDEPVVGPSTSRPSLLQRIAEGNQ